jgi:hypothetical protein
MMKMISVDEEIRRRECPYDCVIGMDLPDAREDHCSDIQENDGCNEDSEDIALPAFRVLRLDNIPYLLFNAL